MTQKTPQRHLHNHNLAHQLADVAASHASFPALASKDEVIPYHAFLSGVVSVARAMQRHGISQGSFVALNTGSMRVSLSVLFATALIGCRFVIAGKALAASTLERPTHFLKSNDAKGKKGVDFIEIDETWMPVEGFSFEDGLSEFEGHATPDDDWILLHTSGTTGRPKYFALTPRMVSLRTAAVAQEFPTAETTIAMLFSATSRPFFARAIATLVNAGCLIDGVDTAYWKDMGVTTVYASPRQADEFFAAAEMGMRLPRLELSGSHVSETLAQKMLNLFDEVIDVYGASETSKTYETFLSRGDDGGILRRGHMLDSEIRITRADGTDCNPNEMGDVSIRNPYLITGYLSDHAAEKQPIKDGWYIPGDIGMWSEDGDFRIIGRVDDVISIGGVKIDAALIDLVLKSVPGVQDAVSFENPRAERPDEIAAFVVFEPDTLHATTVAAIREAYQDTLKLPCFLGKIHSIDAVPRDADGVPNRVICKQMLLQRVAELGKEYSA